MPKITFADQTIECKAGDNLRRVLLKANLPLYNGAAKQIHCRGIGTCGTCCLRIQGEVSPVTRIENWRLGFPPHDRAKSAKYGMRLACQCVVLGDLNLEKFEGMWGSLTRVTDEN
jgi:ferredoxin